MELNTLKFSQLGDVCAIEINGAKIDGVKSFKVELDSNGKAEIQLVICSDFYYTESEIALKQPS